MNVCSTLLCKRTFLRGCLYTYGNLAGVSNLTHGMMGSAARILLSLRRLQTNSSDGPDQVPVQWRMVIFVNESCLWFCDSIYEGNYQKMIDIIL